MTMLLHLTEHPDADALPAFYEHQEVRWRLRIPTAPGQVGVLEPVGAELAVPMCHRTSNVQPALAADRVSYVLGWWDTRVSRARAGHQCTAFVELLGQLARAGHAGAQAAARWYEAGGAAAVKRPPEWESRDLVVLAVDDRDLVDDVVVQEDWRSLVIKYKGTGQAGLCLVCGEVGSLMRSMPGMVSSTLIPGATKPMALVSNRNRATQYDLANPRAGLTSSPICATCAHRSMGGLRAALTGPTHLEVEGQDVRHCWWYSTEPTTDWVAATCSGARHGALLLEQLRVDRDTCAEDVRVYSLMVSANEGRVVPQQWMAVSLRELLGRLVRWWERVAVETGGGGVVVPTVASMVPAGGRYDRAERKYEPAHRPQSWIYRRLATAALEGRGVPRDVVASVVSAAGRDGHVGPTRAAVLNGRG